jgi:hypothetical protein
MAATRYADSEAKAPRQRTGSLRRATCLVAVGAFLAAAAWPIAGLSAADQEDQTIALHLAELLRSARTVVSQYQTVINDPALGDKGLTADRVLAESNAIYQKQTGEDPMAVDPQSREGRLLRAQMDAIKQVMAENQETINAQGVAFKGFIPAVFARLVNEQFEQRAGTEAKIKVTAPENLIRNRKARPDDWESAVLKDKFSSPDWKKGDPFSEIAPVGDRSAFRLLVPEYYKESCLACHGEPAGEVDITGYPKEGGHEGDLGAAISITLFQ